MIPQKLFDSILTGLTVLCLGPVVVCFLMSLWGALAWDLTGRVAVTAVIVWFAAAFFLALAKDKSDG